MASGGEDLSYVTVEVLDAQGTRDPRAVNLMHFQVEGAGSIAGVGNANPLSTESYQLPEHHCWEGRCLVILRSGRRRGLLTLKVSSDGLPASEVSVKVD
jgi:beta-galactosidase